MKSKKLNEAFEYVEDAYLDLTEQEKQRKSPKKRKSTTRSRKKKQPERNRQKLIAGAAVAVLIVVIIFAVRSLSGGGDPDGTYEWPASGVSAEEPEIDVQLLSVNPYSRPGVELSKINGIVVHYTANPGATAQENRDYFQGNSIFFITRTLFINPSIIKPRFTRE